MQRDLSDPVKFVRYAGLFGVRFVNIRDVKKRETDHGRTDRRTDKPSYRDAWTHLKSRRRNDRERGFSLGAALIEKDE